MTTAKRILQGLFLITILLMPFQLPSGFAAKHKVFIDFSKGRLTGHNLQVKSCHNGVPVITKHKGRKYLKIDEEKTKFNIKDNTAYLYFDFNDALLYNVKGNFFITVKYLDHDYGIITAQYDSHDKAYTTALATRNLISDTGKIVSAVFLCENAKFAGSQSGKSDFRLRLPITAKIKEVRLTSAGSRPRAAFARQCLQSRPRARAGNDFEICFGGLDRAKLDEIDGAITGLKIKLPIFNQLGVTSKETYVRWHLVEHEKGKYDFSFFDKQLEIHKFYGIKWVPFVIIGPAYSLPNWFYKSNERVDYVCLEHGRPSDVQSLWNPHLRKYIDAFMREFAQHYKKSGLIENILLGITGNFGESIYIASPSCGSTGDIHGEYHTHSGFWCGDKYAVKAYREWLRKKYPEIHILNKAWRSNYKSHDDIKPSLTAKGRQWLDFVEWYRWSMTEWAEFWIKTTRKHFPQIDIHLVTGGHMPPAHGLDLSAQAKMCAKYNVGIRITNEASDYAVNYQLTRLCASACRFYGIDFGFEPAGKCSPLSGVAGRMYNATASGCKHIHFYESIVCNKPASLKTWITNYHHLKRRKPKIDCALLYPFTSQTLAKQGFPNDIAGIRDIVDIDWVDERMVLDGALDDYPILLIGEGQTYPKEVLQKIEAWIQNGGKLITRSNKRIEDISGRDWFSRKIHTSCSATGVSRHPFGKGEIILIQSTLASGNLARVLFGGPAAGNSAPLLKTVEVDTSNCVRDRVFLTYFESTVLILNFDRKSVKKKFLVDGSEKEIELPPYSITEIPVKTADEK